ncbi:carbon monoxide dehydrogenase [Sulfolobus acidocaldarius SUSAZ]|nr:carbon monoxide dehydrogenase [Sulfolobus acidocaldarius SUSAZ]
MKFEGELQVPFPSDKLWSFITDVEKVASCFPGLKSITKTGENTYAVVGTAGIGFIKGEYKANVQLSNIDQNSKSLNLLAKGTGLNSNLDITALVQLLESPVRLKYSADVKVSGVLASIGARLMDSALNKLLNELFECIKLKAAN